MRGGGGARILLLFSLFLSGWKISRPPAFAGWALLGGLSATRWGASQTFLRIAHSQEARGGGGAG